MAGLMGLPSITTGQGSSPDLSNKSSAASSIGAQTNAQSTGAFTVGGSKGTNNMLIIAGVIALAIIFLQRKN